MKTLYPLKSSIRLSALIVLSSLAISCGSEPETNQDEPAPDVGMPGPTCDFDRSEDVASAVSLAVGQDVEGFVCPVEDQDWYRFSTGTDPRVTIRLEMTSAISPVSPTYGVVDADGVAVATGLNRAGVASGTHCVAPGEHALFVRDSSNAYQDLRNAYRLMVETGPEPDEHEPNGERDAATPLAPDIAKTGYLACDGDEDWYRLEVPGRFIMNLSLTMPITQTQPTLELFDAEGELIQQLSNLAAAREETQIVETVPITAAGTYFLRVRSAAANRADADNAYTVRFSLTEDIDTNEPNDDAEDATVLDASLCGDSWTEWQEREGTFGVAGDVDWFRFDLEGCSPGLLEAEVIFDPTGLSDEAARKIQAAVAMVRVHEPSPCEQDAECLGLNTECQNGWGCAGYGNQCIGGQCAGVGECLPGGRCGALQVQRSFNPSTPANDDGSPAPNRAFISAPIFGDDTLFLRVSDFGGDGSSPSNRYVLRVRTRAETDLNEPSNVYMPESMRSNQPIGLNRAIAVRERVVPVHLCGVEPEDPCLEMQPQCNNQIDDDGDGQTDYPNDPGCTSWTDDTEPDPQNTPRCANEEDDDFDGLIDYPADPDCISASARREDNPSCPGGIEVRRIGDDETRVEGELDPVSQFAGSCGGQGGRERVYALRISYPSQVTVNLDAAFDGIVYSLFDCSPDAQELGCAGNREDLVLNYDGPGTYFIVVDSQDGAGQFTLNIERRVTIELCEGVQKGLPDGGVPEADSGLDAGLDANLDAGIAAPAHDAGLDARVDLATPDANQGVADDARVSPRDAGQSDAGGSVERDAGVQADSALIADSGRADMASGDAAVLADANMSEMPDMGAPPLNFVNHCCGTEESDWIEGSISYEHDQDWYAYRHPCPGEDCMVRIVFQLDGGKVDHLMQVYTGTNLWFDTVMPVQELPMHPASTGRFGGLEAGDQCFYAFAGHGDGPDYLYALSIRDLLPVRDWDPDQKYRFCVEKIADGCHEPPCRRVEVDEETEECSAR